MLYQNLADQRLTLHSLLRLMTKRRRKWGSEASSRAAYFTNMTTPCGPLINVLLCRLQIDDATLMSQLLNDVAAEFIESVEHQYGLAEANRATSDGGSNPFLNHAHIDRCNTNKSL